jgi:parallel beta-helix repeat protein
VAPGVTCSSTLHVLAGAANGDGSEKAPFGGIKEAAAKASAGACIAVGAGNYAAAELPDGVSLLGKGVDHVFIGGKAGGYGLVVKGAGAVSSLPIPIPQPVIRGITLTGEGRGLLLVDLAGGARLEQSRIDGVRDVGIYAYRAGSVVLDHVQVKKVRANDKSEYGIGVIVAEGTQAEIVRSAVADTAAQGIVAAEAAVRLASTAVMRTALHGVAIDCTTDGRCKNVLGSSLTGSTIDRCGTVGLWVKGARITVATSDVGYTQIAGGSSRGVEILDGAIVDLKDNRIHHNDGQGLVIDASTGNLTGNTIDENGERGVWAQSVKSLTLEKNEISKNRKAGFGATNSVGISITGGQIFATKKMATGDGPGIAMVGDGVQVLSKSEVSVNTVRIEGSERIGVLIDGSKATVTGATILGGEEHLLVQNANLADQICSQNIGANNSSISPLVPTIAYFVNADPIKVASLPIPIPKPQAF